MLLSCYILSLFCTPAIEFFSLLSGLLLILLLLLLRLQALEVGIDPAHASFLHRFFEDEDLEKSYGKQFRAASSDSDIPMTRLLREFTRPRIDVEATEYGLRMFALRRLDERQPVIAEIHLAINKHRRRTKAVSRDQLICRSPQPLLVFRIVQRRAEGVIGRGRSGIPPAFGRSPRDGRAGTGGSRAARRRR